MSYANTDFYRNIYNGKLIPDAELDSYLQKASDSIDHLTQNRIQAKGLSSFTDFQQSNIRMAVCAQADHLYETVDLPTGVGSYSINGLSMNFKGSSDYGKYVKGYLIATGLMYRGLV